MDGTIVVDKAEGWTSHDVVAKVRRIAGTRKVGHLGTLDPIATGVLPLVLGRATRLARFYTRSDKVYEAVVRFGFSTDSYDRSGTPTSAVCEPVVDAGELERLLERFRGEIMQTPPPVSAKKIDGARAYSLPRAQAAAELAPVPVQVYELTLEAVQGGQARLHARVSGGTYLRSIAHDLGQAMGYGAHLADLRRLASGEFAIEQARTIEQLQALADENRLEDALISLAQMLPDFPSVYVEGAAQIRQGRNFPASPFRGREARYVKAVSSDGELVAIGEAVLPNLYHPIVVL